ncbi:MAG TPA: ferredoxin reductase family protein [Chloroflexota bacterium]
MRRIISTFSIWGVRLIALVNLTLIIGLWLHGGGISSVHSTGTLLTSVGRITGLLGAYALLIQFLLMARLPFLERLAGFDRLTVWHKRNGKITLSLILAHVASITAGYALTTHISFMAQFLAFLSGYPGMVAALIATLLLLVVGTTSAAMARRKMNYQTWFLIHLMSYSALALAWFHQIPTGTVFLTNPMAAAFWTALYVVTLELVVLFRFGQLVVRNLWHRLRVAEVAEESPGVVSLRITGHHLSWMKVRAGQFFLWRFLDPERWQEAHPFSLSMAPDGQSLRITVKDLGDFSKHIGEITPGTPVVVEGPFGSFTAGAQSSDHVALIAGGVGITPIRALLEEMSGDLVLIYRATREEDVIFRDELDALARERGIKIHYVVGDRQTPGNEYLLSTPHLRQLIPDIARRAIYLCGPPAMMRMIRTNVIRAGVPGRHIHTDQFAF